MKTFAIPFLSGLLFALGLGVSGMTQPAKVIGFLDITGAWDPSLAFVMGGAVVAHWLVLRLGARWLAARGGSAETVQATPVTVAGRGWAGVSQGLREPQLLVGSALFGAGWGLVGLCPGPAIVSVVTLRAEVLVFAASMVGGMLLFRHGPVVWQALRNGEGQPGAETAAAITTNTVRDCGTVPQR